MTEEIAVRIADALESISDAIGIIEGLTIFWTVVLGIALLIYSIKKD